MRVVLTTTDPVLLGFARVVLADSGIEAILADQYTSAIEGSLGIFPRRLLVEAAFWHRARRALADAGLMSELTTENDADGAQEHVSSSRWLLGGDRG